METFRLAAALCAATLATCTLGAVAEPMATTALVTDGTASVALAAPLLRALAKQGVFVAYTDMKSNAALGTFDVKGGVLGLRCGHGEIIMKGGMLLSNGPRTVEVRDWQYENIGNAPFISGVVIANGVPVGRLPMLNIVREGAQTCADEVDSHTYMLKYGKNTVSSLLTVDPQMARFFARYFSLDPLTPVFDPNAAIGSIDYAIVLDKVSDAYPVTK